MSTLDNPTPKAKRDLSKKFMVETVDNWTNVYDTYADAELEAKRKANYNSDRIVVTQIVSEVAKPVENMVVTVY